MPVITVKIVMNESRLGEVVRFWDNDNAETEESESLEYSYGGSSGAC